MHSEHPQRARVIGTGRYIIDRFGQWPEQPFRPTVIKAGQVTPRSRGELAFPLERTFKQRGSLVMQVADLLQTYPRVQLVGAQAGDAVSIAQHAVAETRSKTGLSSCFCSIPEHDLVELSQADTLQEVCRCLFAIDGGGAFWFQPERSYAELANLRALIILDGIEGAAADWVARGLPNAMLVATGSAGQQFQGVKISSLEPHETTSFVDALIREHISPYEPPTASQIAGIGRLLKYAPLPIELLVRLQRSRLGTDWDTLIVRLGEAASADPLDRVAEVCFRQLNIHQRQLLMILCAGKCSRAALQAIHLNLSDDGSSHHLQEDLISLCEIGLVRISNDDCAIASAALRRSFSRVAPASELVQAATDRYVYGMIDQSTDDQLLVWGQQHFAQIMGVYRRNRTGDVRNTKRCLSVLIPVAAGYGWWDKWRELATDALGLAQKFNDSPFEAWAQYELGVQAGLSGRIDQARTQLKQARKICVSLKAAPALNLVDRAMRVLKLRRPLVRPFVAWSARLVMLVATVLGVLAGYFLFPPARSIQAATDRNVSTRIAGLDRRLLPRPGSLWQIEQIDKPAHGSLTATGDGGYIYTPARDYAGEDAFAYVFTNRFGYTWAGNATITVRGDPAFASARLPAVAQVIVRRVAAGQSIDVRGSDLGFESTSGALHFSDVSVSGIGGSVTMIDSGLRFTPPASITGTAVIKLTVSGDQVAAARRLLAIDVGGPVAGQLPDAHNDPDPSRPRYRVDLATPAQVMLNVLDNDTDLQGQPLTVRLPAATSLLGAQLNVSADGREVLYEIGDRPRGAEPREDADAFIYQACNPGGACAWALVSMVVGVPAYSWPLSTFEGQPAPTPTAAIVAPMAFFPSAASTDAQFMLIGSGFQQSESITITLIDPAGHVFDTTAVTNDAGIASVQLAARSDTPGVWVASLRGNTSGNLTLTTFQVAALSGAGEPIEQAGAPAAIEMSDR